MSTLLRFISLLSIPLALLMFYGLIRSVGKAQLYRKQIYIRGILMASLMMAVNVVFMVQAFFAWCPGIWPLFILAGLGFGYLWGKTSRVFEKGNALYVKRSILHLVFWAASYTFTHLLTTVFPAGIAAAGMAAMFFSTGSSIGMNTNLVLRSNRNLAPIQPSGDSAQTATGESACQRCGKAVKPDHAFCGNCGFRLR